MAVDEEGNKAINSSMHRQPRRSLGVLFSLFCFRLDSERLTLAHHIFIGRVCLCALCLGQGLDFTSPAGRQMYTA